MEIAQRNKLSRGRGRYGERRLAEKVNGVVIGRSKAVKLASGWVQVDCNKPPDVLGNDGLFSYESKWIKNVPVSLSKVMTQAVSNAPAGFIPVGVIGDRVGHCVYYILMESDFLSLLVGEKPDTGDTPEPSPIAPGLARSKVKAVSNTKLPRRVKEKK